MSRKPISETSRRAIADLLSWAEGATAGDEYVYFEGRTPDDGHELGGLFRVVRNMSERAGRERRHWFVFQRLVAAEPDGARVYAYTIRAVAPITWHKLERFSPHLGPIYA
jgi:hypothetical protein